MKWKVVKKAGKYLISQYKKNGISFPKGAKDYYQLVPAAYLNAKYNENLSDSENVWAFIEGSEHPEEIVVVSAHYDHVGMKNGEIYNGADDDGSGTVALLEIAQAFQIAKNEVIMYETDLTDAQWQVIKNHLPNIERRRKNSLREILNAILYLNKTGCQWRYLPKNYPKWQLVFYYFNLWQIDEIWDDLMIRLTEMTREKINKNS